MSWWGNQQKQLWDQIGFFEYWAWCCHHRLWRSIQFLVGCLAVTISKSSNLPHSGVSLWELDQQCIPCDQLSIWSEFDFGRFSSNATDLVTENIWVSAGNFIKFWTMTKGDLLRRRSSRSIGNRRRFIYHWAALTSLEFYGTDSWISKDMNI